MCLRELQREIHRYSREKGWWDRPRDMPELIALCHSELSEALECWRKGPTLDGTPETIPIPSYIEVDDKPEGWAVEFADLFIRVLDLAEYYGVDMEGVVRVKQAYNWTRPHRHGGLRA